MASRDYCVNVAAELEHWSERLHKLSGAFDRIPSINKYHLLPQIEELHILMTELDDRLGDLVNACPTVEIRQRSAERMGSESVTSRGDSNRTESFDYDFGG